jgi:hypothetical protein
MIAIGNRGGAPFRQQIGGQETKNERCSTVSIDPQRTSPTLAHRDAAIRCGVLRELVFLWHLLFLQGGSNEASGIHEVD